MAKIDDSVKKKVPELRFPGFTDDWEQRKFGELYKKTLSEIKIILVRTEQFQLRLCVLRKRVMVRLKTP